MNLTVGVYIGIFAAVLLSLIVRSRFASHVLLGAAGALGLFYGWWAHGLLGIVVPALVGTNGIFYDVLHVVVEVQSHGLGQFVYRQLVDGTMDQKAPTGAYGNYQQ